MRPAVPEGEDERGIVRRAIVVIAVAASFMTACSSSGSESGSSSACRAAVKAAEASSDSSDEVLGALQDATLTSCSSAADFTAAWKARHSRAFNGETREQSAHNVLAAYCGDPVSPAMKTAAPCADLARIDPACSASVSQSAGVSSFKCAGTTKP